MQFGRIAHIDLKVPPRPPGYAFVEVGLELLKLLWFLCFYIFFLYGLFDGGGERGGVEGSRVELAKNKLILC